MRRRHLLGLSLATAAVLALAACGGATPAPTAAPTKAPAAAAPTKAPAAAAPTTAPTKAPAAAPAPTKAAAQPTAAPAPAKAVQKPAGFPSKAISLVIPWDAGGSTDVGFRLIAPVMEKIVGQPVQPVNRPGAGSQVGVAELAKAAPDGYTIGNVSAPAVQTIYLDEERKATFAWKDFAPVALHVFDPGAITVKADSKYRTLKDLIDDAKAKPEQIKASTTGVLGDDHLAILQMQRSAGVKFAIVHFTGGAPALTALLGGHTDVQFGNVGDFGPRVKDGSVRVLAVMDEKRSEFLPDVPTVQEAIGTKLVSSSSRGVAAPAGTPNDIVWYLSDAWRQSMEDPGVKQKMAEVSLSQRYMNPDEFNTYWLDFENTVKELLPEAKATSK